MLLWDSEKIPPYQAYVLVVKVDQDRNYSKDCGRMKRENINITRVNGDWKWERTHRSLFQSERWRSARVAHCGGWTQILSIIEAYPVEPGMEEPRLALSQNPRAVTTNFSPPLEYWAGLFFEESLGNFGLHHREVEDRGNSGVKGDENWCVGLTRVS